MLAYNLLQLGSRLKLTDSSFNRLSQYVSSPGRRAYCYAELAVSSLVVAKTTAGTYCRWETDESRKVRFAQTHRTICAGWFAQQGMIRSILWMFHASKLLCCVSFKLRFNYFIYLINQLFVWVLLVVDVNLGYMHISIIVKLTLKFISVTW